MKNQTVQITFEVTPVEAQSILTASAIRQEACFNDLEEGAAGCTVGYALSLICARYEAQQAEGQDRVSDAIDAGDRACVA